MKGIFAPWLAEAGFNWTSDKAVIDACQRPKQLLKVINKVSSIIEPAFIRNIILQQSGDIEFSQKFKAKGQSELVDLMVVRHIFHKSGAKFRIAELANVRRNREIVKKILGHLRRLLEWRDRLMQANDEQQTHYQILENNIQDKKQELAELTEKYEEMQRTKELESVKYKETEQ